MSNSTENNRLREEPSLGATLPTDFPAQEEAWDIPLEEGLFTSSRVPRPDPRNNPRTEIYARILASIGAVLLTGTFAMWIFLADLETLSFFFFRGSTAITNMGLFTLAGMTALGSILLVLVLHPVMRALVRSKVPPRTLDATQRAILEMIPGPIFFLNTEARLEDVNSAFTRAVGRSANDIIGRSIYDFIPESDRDTAYQALLKIAAREEEGWCCPITTKGGTRIFNILAEPYQGHNTESQYIVGVALDVTEDKAAADVLESRCRNMQATTMQTLEIVAHAVEMRDPYLLGHHERVSKLCGALADQLNLPADEKTAIELAARAHDIGTIGIPFEIQIKPGKLSKAEIAIIEEHAQVGAEILSHIDFPWPVADIVRQHHEFFDGSGYPNGLKGSDISIGGRILAVADAYDALISQRPYRAAISRIKALQRVMSLSGEHYDPKVVGALSTILQHSITDQN